MGNWTLIYSARSPHEAEMVRALLDDHDIAAVVMDHGSSAYPQLSDVAVYVGPDDAVKALHIVRNLPAA